MVGALVFDKDAGLRQGIEQTGSILGSAIQQRGQKKKVEKTGSLFEEEISEAAKKGPIGTREFSTVLSSVLSKGGDPATLKMFSDTYAPQLKASSYAQETQQRRKRYQPISNSDGRTTEVGEEVVQQGPNGQVQEEGIVEESQQPESSAIDQVKSFKPREIEESLSTVETPSGTLRTADFVDTPFGKYHPREVQEMLGSSNPADQKEAQLLFQFLANEEKAKGKEGAEVRKEWRSEIREFNKPFSDVPKIKNAISQLNRAKDLVSSGKVSLDDNWGRNAIVAALDDRQASSVSELVKTGEQRELYSIIYNFLNSKGLGGSNPSTREVMLSLAAKPSGLKGEAENMRILDGILKEEQINLARGEVANELGQRQGPISFSRYKMEMNDLVDKRMEIVNEDLKQETQLNDAKRATRKKPAQKGFSWMIDPTGSLVQIPNKEIKRAENSGGRRVNGK